MNCTARWITNAGKRTKTVKLMEKCKWLKASKLIEVYTTIMFWKLIKWKIPAKIHKKIEKDTDHKVSVRKPRLLTTQLGFLWRASVLWNNLPSELRSQDNLKKKKKKKKKCTSTREGWKVDRTLPYRWKLNLKNLK